MASHGSEFAIRGLVKVATNRLSKISDSFTNKKSLQTQIIK